MSPLRRLSDTTARRQPRDRQLRALTRAAAWLVLLLLALPLVDLLRRAGAGLEWATFAGPDSMDPAAAGMGGALRATLLAMLPVVLVALPLGLAVAVWLEEIAGRRGAGRVVGDSIRHLAMLPPVIFGLLGFGGLVVVLGMQAGTPLLAGAVLGLAVLPRTVLAGQFALRQVPPQIREAGHAMGASPLQVVATHVVPHAAPAMLGAALSMLARALGEAAPLLLVGFVAFSAGVPRGVNEPGMPLPALIFRWGELPDALFAAKAAVAALVLLAFVGLLGWTAWWLERRGSST